MWTEDVNIQFAVRNYVLYNVDMFFIPDFERLITQNS